MKMTKKRMAALIYANNQGENRQPTYAVCHALEKLGLIKWVGTYGRGFGKIQNPNCKRPWQITATGKDLLQTCKPENT